MLSIEQATKKILISNPFYGFILLSVNRRFAQVDENVRTACAKREGCNYEILVNESYWQNLKDDSCRCNLLLHEILHLALSHLQPGLYDNLTNLEARNIAMDCEVSSYCGYITDNAYTYKTFDLPPRLGVRKYYKELMKNSTQIEVPGKSLVDDHSMFGDGDPGTPAERELADVLFKGQIKAAAQQTYKQRGQIPSELQDLVSSLFKIREPVFNWKTYFRRLLGNIHSEEIKKTRKKESERFPGASGLKTKRKVSLFVVIDTSGSVDPKELNEFFNEIQMIYKAGARITICECSCTVTNMYEYTGKWDGKITGRGGTFMSPAIEEFNKRRKEYQSIIFFTDGFIESDPIKIEGKSVWIITSTGNTERKYPGKTIIIPIKY